MLLMALTHGRIRLCWRATGAPSGVLPEIAEDSIPSFLTFYGYLWENQCDII